GVEREVDQHLLELTRVDRGAHRVGRRRLQRDRLADQPPQQVARVRDDVAQVDQLGLQRLLAAERQQLPWQGRSLLCGAPDLPGVRTERIVAVERAEQQL